MRLRISSEKSGTSDSRGGSSTRGPFSFDVRPEFGDGDAVIDLALETRQRLASGRGCGMARFWIQLRTLTSFPAMTISISSARGRMTFF